MTIKYEMDLDNIKHEIGNNIGEIKNLVISDNKIIYEKDYEKRFKKLREVFMTVLLALIFMFGIIVGIYM